MAQGLQHGQGILIGTAVLRSSERENAELDRHTGYSVRKRKVSLRAEPSGSEIGIKLSDIGGLLDRSDERLETLPLSFF